MQIESWLLKTVKEYPEQIAIDDGQRRLSYRQLLDLASRTAHALSNEGVQKGEEVIIALPRGIDYVLAVYAAWLLGAKPVLLDDRLADPELKVRVRNARTVISEPVDVSGVEKMQELAHSHDSRETATVIYTSGTTGTPTAVNLTYANWDSHVSGFLIRSPVATTDSWLCSLPFSHVSGVAILIRCLCVGATVRLQRRFDVQEIWELINKEMVTVISLVPTMLRRMLDTGKSVSSESFRFALVGGAPVAAELLHESASAGIKVITAYGKTETTTQIASSSPSNPGRVVAFPGVELAVSKQGELLARGSVVAPGFVDSEGWHRTGDLGQISDTGEVTVTGRKDRVIISGGENISPEEVEAVLRSCPGIREAAVYAVSHREWGQETRAFVILDKGIQLEQEQVIDLLKADLAAYKLPKKIAFVESLPRLENGKIDYRAVQNIAGQSS